MIKYKLIDQGAKADIYSILDNDDREVFFTFLQDLNTAYQKPIVKLVEKIKDRGFLLNKTIYELMNGTTDIYEWKIRVGGGYRILTLRIGEKPKFDYIILKCFKKPSQKKQRRYISQTDTMGSEIRAGYAVLVTE